MEQEQRLLKASDVAKRLSVSIAFAYRLMQNGDIPTVKIRRSVRVREVDLTEFILQRLTSKGSMN